MTAPPGHDDTREQVGRVHAGELDLPIDAALIAGYLAHLGPGETRLLVEHVAGSGEALLDRMAAAGAAGGDDRAMRRLAHDIAGTLGTLGFVVHAALAHAIETALPDTDRATREARLASLLAARGRIGRSALAALDRILPASEGSP